jgi:hypothetical protein
MFRVNGREAGLVVSNIPLPRLLINARCTCEMGTYKRAQEAK